MKSIRQLRRLLFIWTIFARNGMDKVLVSVDLFSPLRFLTYCNPWNWFRKETPEPGVAIRKTLEELGPIFIKLGQTLSTRPDIITPEIARELSKLQDKVPPFPPSIVLAMIEKTYGLPADKLFLEFNPEALASASIAQVHAAVLHTGESVVVKILRPNIERIITEDLSLMHTMAKILDKIWPPSKRIKPNEIVNEFEYSLLNELNLQREAANATKLRQNFTNSPLLYIPEIHWDYVRENILVMERIYGIPVSDMAALVQQGTDLKKLAERGVEIFFTQVFRDCFFHADMHPGNIFVSYQKPHDPQFICVDFGIVGTLTDSDKRYLAENLLAFFKRDYKRIALLHVESGWVDDSTIVQDFEASIRTVCEPVFEKPLKDISFAQLILGLIQVARRYQMNIQPQLILLQKTLLAIEGLGRQLYPDLDLWTTAKPFLEKWVREQIGPKAFFKQLKENIPYFAEQLPHLPRLIHEVLALSKEEKRNTLLANQQLQKKTNQWIKGLGTGLFASMALIIIVHYFELMDKNSLILSALGLAGFGAMMVFFSRNRRSN